MRQERPLGAGQSRANRKPQQVHQLPVQEPARAAPRQGPRAGGGVREENRSAAPRQEHGEKPIAGGGTHEALPPPPPPFEPPTNSASCCAPRCEAGTCSNKRVRSAAEEFYERDLAALIYEVGAEHAKQLIQEHGCRVIEFLGIAHALRRTGALDASNVVDPVDEYAVQQLMEELEAREAWDLDDEQYLHGCTSEAMYKVDPVNKIAVHQLIESVIERVSHGAAFASSAKQQ